MQHSSLVLFCDECGLANDPAANHCAACQYPLSHTKSVLNPSPAVPITITPRPVLEVTPGPFSMSNDQDTHVALSRYLACDFQPGSVLAGRYQIQEEIGRGGFSTVYRAVDKQTAFGHRQVAIKRIQLGQLTPRQAIDATETFNREVAALPGFKDKEGIPAYYTHLIDGENRYLITEYIAGQTLEAYLQKAPGGHLDEKEVIAFGIGIAEILKTLHASEPLVIFRDLKPANIMLTPGNKFCLIDFGTARTFMPGKTKDTTPLGSPGYAPPEQYGRAQTDQRSDIYSLGATLQTLLTGRDPLELQSGEPSLNPKSPSRGLRKLLDEMLSVEMEQRPADIAQVQKRLEFIQFRPAMVYLVGIVFGLAYECISGSFSLIPAFNKSWMGLVTLSIPLVGAGLVESFVRAKLKLPNKIPKGLRRFWWLGLLSGPALLSLLAFLSHIFFGWPF